MTKTQTILLILAVAVIIIVVVAFGRKNSAAPVAVTPEEQTSSIVGCYVATLDKDVYTLQVTQQEGISAEGTLRFKNFQKDSSSGSFTGTYDNGILLGNYSFTSEGTDSVMSVIFKKTGNDFVRGFGDMESSSVGERFVDVSKVTYDSNQTFKPTACTQ